MQSFASFKAVHKIGQVQFFPSKQGTGRFVGSSNGITMVTVKGFDPKQPTFVAEDPNKSPNLFFLTNKNSEGVFTL